MSILLSAGDGSNESPKGCATILWPLSTEKEKLISI
jgi:hypothetical protein